jgi:uncharacterized protein (TIGR00255 family)
MTGFGKAEFENNEIKIDVEIKSLNSKSLDLRIKLPNISAEKELIIRNYISKNLTHGKIDCTITIENKLLKGNYSINQEIFDKYYGEFDKVVYKYGKNMKDINFYPILMSLPEVVSSKEITMDKDWDNIYQTLEKATNNFLDFRKQEGKSIENDLVKCIDNIEFALKDVPKFEKERGETMRNKILSFFKEQNLAVDKDRLESEMIFYIEKFDINEEKIRLSNHLKYFIETLVENNVGKKLNFIAQEIGREINTMGSKANHFEIQKLVVKMKDELEKIKEQTLNIL